MDTNQLIGYFFAVLVGISLGLMGSGGSILTVPILVYIMGVSPILATAYSLFIVGMTAITGSIRNAFASKIDYGKVIVFGIPSVISVFLTRLGLVPRIPEVLYFGNFEIAKPIFIMTLFALFMISASFSMFKSVKKKVFVPEPNQSNQFAWVFLIGIAIGIIAGLVGAGGGFLIIPALVVLMKTPMKKAVATSLAIVAIQSMIGFSGDLLSNRIIDWKLLLTFTGFSIIGIYIGILLGQKISAEKLKKGFAWFVLLMGVYIILKESLDLFQ